MFSYRCLLVVLCGLEINALQLTTHLSQNGIHGEITFTHLQGNYIKIHTKLEATLEFPNEIWSWSLMEFPVDYSKVSSQERCADANLGRTVFVFDEIYGYLTIPENSSSELVINQEKIGIRGPNGLYGRSLLLKSTSDLENRRACSTIILPDDKEIFAKNEHMAFATFHAPIAGMMHFQWLTSSNITDALIYFDLYYVPQIKPDNTKQNETRKREEPPTSHKWKIFITDILGKHQDTTNCNVLQLVFNSHNNHESSGYAVGDVDSRLGLIKVARSSKSRHQTKTILHDSGLEILPSDLRDGKRQLYVVIYDNLHPDSFLDCAKIEAYTPTYSKALIQGEGIHGDVTLKQNSRFHPTMISISLQPTRGDLESKLIFGSQVGAYRIHELPKNPPTTLNQTNFESCRLTNNVYNPSGVNLDKSPPPGFGTFDQYAIGDISGKLMNRKKFVDLIPGSWELRGTYWDVFLPLQGPFSVVHRSFVIHKQDLDGKNVPMAPWICSNLALYEAQGKIQTQMLSARVIFRYPLVGSILFRQKQDHPNSDTMILIEKLVHADGAQLNNTHEHRWSINEYPHKKDFYNWTGRCLSAGNIYNPHKFEFDQTKPECSHDSIGYCRLGDLTLRSPLLSIAGKNVDSNRISRMMLTDTNLPLSGPFNIMGRSLVIYDDHGPKARGERLACSIINRVFHRKAVVRDWFGNGNPVPLSGKIEFFQQSEYDTTNIELNLEGLQLNSGYHVHMTPVQSELEFPCEGTTLYDHWNPMNVDPNQSPRDYHGTSDQYEMGDLSGKFGTLDGKTWMMDAYNDTILPLYGPQSILGRSVIIHKKTNNLRWACSTIERGYSPSEARELRGIASFHHPSGYAYGYIRMTQLVNNDGSKSDTVIEVNLRHPGKNDRNVTYDHNWAIFVNPVGVDASVKVYATRCVAGGYQWNPYYTQLADPLNTELYRQECGQDNPLRCYVGDVSGRLGTIDIGAKRQVFTDSNFPLEGDETAIGRSIVIFSPNRGGERFACANIEPDFYIIKYSNIEKPPRFVLAQFISDIRHVLGVPEWMIGIDSRKTKTLHHGGCVQFLLHFKGPIAGALERDYTRLLINGRLDSPTLYIPGFVDQKRKANISYRQCGVSDPNDRKRGSRFRRPTSSESRIKPWTSSFILVILLLLQENYYK